MWVEYIQAVTIIVFESVTLSLHSLYHLVVEDHSTFWVSISIFSLIIHNRYTIGYKPGCVSSCMQCLYIRLLLRVLVYNLLLCKTHNSQSKKYIVFKTDNIQWWGPGGGLCVHVCVHACVCAWGGGKGLHVCVVESVVGWLRCNNYKVPSVK